MKTQAKKCMPAKSTYYLALHGNVVFLTHGCKMLDGAHK